MQMNIIVRYRWAFLSFLHVKRHLYSVKVQLYSLLKTDDCYYFYGILQHSWNVHFLQTLNGCPITKWSKPCIACWSSGKPKFNCVAISRKIITVYIHFYAIFARNHMQTHSFIRLCSFDLKFLKNRPREDFHSFTIGFYMNWSFCTYMSRLVTLFSHFSYLLGNCER